MISRSDFWVVASAPAVCLSCDLMMLVPFCWWMLKVSVTTRWPLMKTPNEPESTAGAEAGFDLSFFPSLGAAALVAAGNASKTNKNPRTQPAALYDFTRLLLILSGQRYSPGPASRRFRRRLRSRYGCRLEFSAMPSDSSGAANHTAGETDRCPSAMDALPGCRPPAGGSAAIILRRAHPGTPWVRQRPRSTPRLQAGQTPHLPRR